LVVSDELSIGAGGTFIQNAASSSFGTFYVGGVGSLTSGTLTAANTDINDNFAQSGGVSNLGVFEVTDGIASLTGGTLNATASTISFGAFDQSGGTAGLGTLVVDTEGVATLTAGTLTATATNVGFASYEQSGGVAKVGTLAISGSGFGYVDGGSFTATSIAVSGNGSKFEQATGISSLGTLEVETLGFALLSGGSLTATATTVSSGGEFEQMGGSSSLGSLQVGTGTTSNGEVVLVGGLLNATSTVIGGTGHNAYYQGGSLSVANLGPLEINSLGFASLGGGTTNVASFQVAGTIDIVAGTLAITGAGSLGGSSITSAGLSISGTGVLDVGSSGVVIEYGSGASPVGDLSFARTARNYPANSIQRCAQTAINGLNWNGPGISSSFAENDPNGLTAVGVADENDLLNVYPSNYTVAGGGNGTWMGQSINDPNNVLVRMTYYGDGNLDGVVNRLDVSALSQGYTYSGEITKVDVGLLAQSYLFQGAPLGDAITSAQAQYLLALDPDMPADVKADFESIGDTPEPTSAGLLAIGAVGLLGRKRMRHASNGSRL
jgi:hypothetical protein